MSVIKDLKTIFGEKQVAQIANQTKDPQEKVLIVEDDAILREMYQDKFVKEGFSVITADNGKKGLEETLSQKPDIILLDLMMPVMDGKIMLKRLREFPQFKRLPVIVLTNAGEVSNIRETKHFDDACEFLIKSNVSVDELVEKVHFWLKAQL